ncbi:hypothetical protein [Desulfuromonas thiophila]|uniref:hypothetical protein n=1 Tax=Desulfuromonas thiophila TaxID=57664 RepID=UPI0024A7C020|nr:hypothetical protein [Desulfuromonas thiophila]
MAFVIGRKIVHPEYGEAIVRFVGEERIGLEFPDGQQALFKKDDLNKSPLDYDMAAAEGKTDIPWPQSTFIPDGEEEEHSPGAHWQPFVDDTGEILAKLPEYLKSAREKNALGLLLKPERALPEDWTKGFALAWPSVQEGLAISIRIAAGVHEIVSVFPFTRGGSQHQLTVKKVRVWEDGLTAQIDALFGNAVLTFFDTDFVANRGWYEAECSQEFLLTGLAYSARPAEIFEISVTHSPDEVAWFNQLLKSEEREPLQEEETLSLRGMAMLLPTDDGDWDEYSFRGEVLQINPFSNFLGQNGWCVRVRVMRDMPDDLDLEIRITEKVWQGTQPLRVGDDIEGTLWLQGFLWSTEPTDDDDG